MNATTLSEFWWARRLIKKTPLRRLQYNQLGWVLSMCLFGLAVITVIVGHFSRSNAAQILYGVELLTATGWQPVGEVSYTYGYLAMLNHGMYYLLVAPVFLLIAFKFLRAVETSFQSMIGSRLLPTGDSSSFSRHYARKNRSRFSVLSFLLISFWLIYYPAKDVGAHSRATKGEPPDSYGYVEVPFVKSQKKNLDFGTTDTTYLSIPGKTLRSGVDHAVRSGLTSVPTSIPAGWHGLVRLNGGLTNASLPDISSYLLSGKDIQIDVAGALDRELVRLNVSVTGGPESPGAQRMYWVFLSGVWIMEGLFSAFVCWLVLKVVFWIKDLFDLLPPSREGSKFLIKPVLNDKSGRFGLQELHNPYNAGMLLIVLGGLVLSFSYISKTALSNPTPGNLIYYQGTLLIFVAVVVSLITYLWGPVYLFDRRLKVVKEGALARLDREAVRLTSKGDDLSDLLEQKTTVRSQTTWPRNDGRFNKLMWLSIGFVILPWALMLGVFSSELEEHLSVLRWAESTMQWVCNGLYF